MCYIILPCKCKITNWYYYYYYYYWE